MIGSIPTEFGWLHDDAALTTVGGGRTLLLLALIGAGAAMLAAIIVGRLRRDRACHGPVVRHLARGVGLSPHELRLLERVARAAGRPHAGSLLVSRGCFDAAVRVYAERHPAPRRLTAIRRTIFEVL